MKTIKLGQNGPLVSAIGLGCMRMSTWNGSSGRDGDGILTIQAALDAGISFLNTGDFYGMGHNESLVGRAIHERRDRAFVSVKFGVMRSPSGIFLGLDGRPEAVKNFASYSLQRLGLDVIDLYQPARVDPNVPIEETIGAIADLIKEGKVRYLGLSELSPEDIRKAHQIHPVTALEFEYSLGSRSLEGEILSTVRELGIGVVAFGVAGHGLLTGTIKGPLPSEDARNMFPRFQGENLKKNLEKAAFLQRMAMEKNCSPTQLAIAWVLSRGDDVMALVGMSHKSQVEDNLAGLDIKLTQDDLAALEQAFPINSFIGGRTPTFKR